MPTPLSSVAFGGPRVQGEDTEDAKGDEHDRSAKDDEDDEDVVGIDDVGNVDDASDVHVVGSCQRMPTKRANK